MKLNFWQWLGIVIVIVGAVGWYLYKMEHPDNKTATQPTAQVP